MLKRPFLISRTSRASTIHRRNASRKSSPLIRIKNGTFYRSYPSGGSQKDNPPLFPKLDFNLYPNANEHWAVVGSTGRTILLDVLRGQYFCTPPDARSYPYLSSDEIAAKDPRLRYFGNAIRYVGFSGEGSQANGGIRGAYLSARYESLREDTDWTVRQYLKGQTSLNPIDGEEEGTIHDEAFLKQVVSKLKLEELLDMPVANLSNGQTRRARIAKTLLAKPELLLLDEPFMGLDPATTNSISMLLRDLAQESNPSLALALRPQDKLPTWITHILLLGNGHRILFQGEKSTARKLFKTWKSYERAKASGKDKQWRSSSDTSLHKATVKALESGTLDDKLLMDMRPLWEEDSQHQPSGNVSNSPNLGAVILEMEGVQVRYGDKMVLGGWHQIVDGAQKEGLHWKVRRGQHWAILGANGSGKTTLLSLITSDHPQAYAQPVRLFGRSRLPQPGKPAISLFDLQSKIGHSSPEVHAFFPRKLTVREALESAWADTFLSKPKMRYKQDLDVDRMLRIFEPELNPDFQSKNTRKNVDNGSQRPVKDQDTAAMITGLAGFVARGVPPRDKTILQDDLVTWADSLHFSTLSVAQQRLVLFLRAIIHQPDLIILDEAFSGMSPSLRTKCFLLLESGEAGLHREKSMNQYLMPDQTLTETSARFPGLTSHQSLIIVSHVKEEIPHFVRNWMRLPSDVGADQSLDFKTGVVHADSSLSSLWDSIWGIHETETKRR